jgi:hypothetical protein
MSEELSKRIDDLEIEFKQVGSLIAELIYNLASRPKPPLEPKKCPVCAPGLMNKALAQIYMKNNPNEPLVCPACEGSGVLWR